MKALILAAGLGTRLRPLTLEVAKPSLPIVGIPTMWFGAWHLKRELQISEFAINMGHGIKSLKAAAEELDLVKFTGINFHFSDESSQILGSSGVFSKLRPWLGKHSICVSNADTVSMPSWKKMLEFHREKGALMTMHVRAFRGDSQYTNIEIDPDQRVVALGQKTASGTMFSGSYIVDSSVLDQIPNGVSELVPTVIEPLIKKKQLYAFCENIEMIDTGTIDTYARAQFDLIKKFPKFRELVDVRMKEIAPQVWVSKKSDPSGINFLGPVVICGELKKWTKHSNQFGPYFIGIDPPVKLETLNAQFRHSSALVTSTHIEYLEKF